jgi:hypothetical protein
MAAGVLIGLPIGMFVFGSAMSRLIFGTIKWVREEGEDPYLFLDMDKRPELMADHKYVLFRTDLKDPHK